MPDIQQTPAPNEDFTITGVIPSNFRDNSGVGYVGRARTSSVIFCYFGLVLNPLRGGNEYGYSRGTKPRSYDLAESQLAVVTHNFDKQYTGVGAFIDSQGDGRYILKCITAALDERFLMIETSKWLSREYTEDELCLGFCDAFLGTRAVRQLEYVEFKRLAFTQRPPQIWVSEEEV